MRRHITRLLMSLLTLLLLIAAATPASAHGEPPGEAIEVDLEITDATVDPRTGTVTVTGTLSCSEEGMAWVSVDVRQRVGRFHTVVGWVSTEVQCGPQPTPVTLILDENETYGVFKPGKVHIRGSAHIGFCDPETGECRFGHDDVDVTMRLHRAR